MPIRNNLSVQFLFKDAMQEFKILAFIFLAIVVTTSLLLMTSLPKSILLWGSFFAAIILPILLIDYRGYIKKKRKVARPSESASSVFRCNEIRNYIYAKNNEKKKALKHIQQNPVVSRRGNILLVFSPQRKNIEDYMQELLCGHIEKEANIWAEKTIQAMIRNQQAMIRNQQEYTLPRMLSMWSPAKNPLKDFNPTSTARDAVEPTAR